MNIDKIGDAVSKRLDNLSGGSLLEVYKAVSDAVMDEMAPVWASDRKEGDNTRRACYMSAEFLVGRMIYSNLTNLGALSEVTRVMKEKGLDIAAFEEIEDAALGNGGLGRLAACFLDSAASLGLKLDGYGIRYRFGLFKQSFENGFQKERADDWTRFGDPWSVRREGESVTVTFGDGEITAVPYDMPVIGYGAKRINTLRLWQSEAKEPLDFTRFDSCDYLGAIKSREAAERVSAVLYPNDNTKKGKELRLKQEYFFSSASLQDMLRRFKATGKSVELLPEAVVVQLNDTHPVICIPELIRLLEKEGVSFERGLELSKKIFAYTNHTVMSEALEKWDVRLIKKVLPGIYPVIVKINDALLSELKERSIPDTGYRIIEGGSVHMARLACYVGFAINGVAKIHTEILKADTLKEWYNLAPEKFFNKTNGITQRRWLKLCNPDLYSFIASRIGEDFVTDLDKIEGLKKYAEDKSSLEEFKEIKQRNKAALCDYIYRREGVKLDPSFIFDVQIKRLHEYKRQLLNALSIIYIYNGLKDGSIKDFKPTAFIFGAKAAPGYRRAKGIIKFINEIARKVNADPETSDKLKVIYVTDYNVSYAEKICAAGEVSEQISAAGTEASGTGNMKLMLNGAVTLGTYDGANIEIAEAAGEQNNYIFGARVEELNQIRDTYNSKEFYESDAGLKKAVDSLVDGTFDDCGTGMFKELYDSLLKGASWHRPDQYFLLKDFKAYVEAKLSVNRDYGSEEFVKKCLINTASAGRFSSDRTIKEYAAQIWKI